MTLGFAKEVGRAIAEESVTESPEGFFLWEMNWEKRLVEERGPEKLLKKHFQRSNIKI